MMNNLINVFPEDKIIIIIIIMKLGLDSKKTGVLRWWRVEMNGSSADISSARPLSESL